MQARYEQGQLCPNTLENGSTCGALMVEKSVFWHCAKCGHVLMLSASERQAKLQKAKNEANMPNRVGFVGTNGQNHHRGPLFE